jgi:hypothetical protein
MTSKSFLGSLAHLQISYYPRGRVARQA